MSLTPENTDLLMAKRNLLQLEMATTSHAPTKFELKHRIKEIDAELAGASAVKLPTLAEIVQTEKLSLVFEIAETKVDFGSEKAMFSQLIRENLSDQHGFLEISIRDRLRTLIRRRGSLEMLIDINEFNSVSVPNTSNLVQNPVSQHLNTPKMNTSSSSLRSHEGISIEEIQKNLFNWKKDFKRRNPKLGEDCTELLKKVNNYRLTLEQDSSFDSCLRRFKSYLKKYRGLKLRAEKKQDEKFENFEEQIREYLLEDIPSLKNLEKAYKRLKLKGYQNPTAEQLIEDEIEDEDIILDVVENMEKFLETF